MSIITDGTGSSTKAKVDKTNKFNTRAITISQGNEATSDDDGYFISTPLINLTSANNTSIIFFINNEDRALIASAIIIHNTESTGGTEETFRVEVFSGATALSTSSTFVPVNNKIGSANTLNGTYLSGVEGSALTGGASIALLVPRIGFITAIPSDVFVPKGGSIGVTITPPANNTSWNVSISFVAFLQKDT